MRKWLKIKIWIMVILLPTIVFADDVFIATDDTLVNSQEKPHLNESDLLNDMTLFHAIILQAIDNQRVDDVRTLMNLYQKSENQDSIIYNYANAYLAMSDKKYKVAIDCYNNILDSHPNYNQIRLLLMQALAYDLQYDNAKKQLEILYQDESIDNNIKIKLDHDKQWLESKQEWQFYSNFGFLYDKNINNAPKNTQYHNWQLQPKMTAYGVGLDLTAKKTDNIHNNLFGYYLANVDINIYNKHQFDDIYTTLGVGVMHQDSKKSLGILPYYQKRWYGTEPYSDSVGTRLWYEYKFNQNIQANLSTLASKNWHNQREFLDGESWSVSTGLNYNNYSVSLSHYHQNTKDKSESYTDNGILISMQQKYKDLYGAHRIGVYKRNYNDKDIFSIKRYDMGYILKNSFWHDKIHYKGYVPSINIDYERIDSNHFAFDKEDTKIYMEINKVF